MHYRLLTAVAAIATTTLLAGSASAETADSAKPAAAQTAAPKSYTVTSGDSLSTIAAMNGLDSWRPLWNINTSLSDPNLIYPGQSLTIPTGNTTDRALPVGVESSAPQTQVEAVRPYVSATAQPESVTPVARATQISTGSDIFARIRKRESGGNYAVNTGNGYYGAYQFDLGTWRSNAPSDYTSIRPDQAPAAVQDQAAANLYARRGCSPWPNTCY